MKNISTELPESRKAEGYTEESKMRIANNYDEFMKTVMEAERKTLNSPLGQELTQKLLEMKVASNPKLTPEEWQQTKSEFMTFIFAFFMKEKPELRQEFAGHVWNELRKQ